MTSFVRLLLFFPLFFPVTAKAYENATHDLQTWTNITANAPFNRTSKLRYWLETQNRFGDDVSRLSQFLVRPGLGYALNQTTSLWLGYGWFYTSIPFAYPHHEENRIWQQYLWVKDYLSFNFTHRMRLEQRFIQNLPYVQWRFRDWWKVSIPLKEQSQFSFVAHNEIFLHFEHKAFTQNRLFVGLGNQISKHIRTEIGYMNQRIYRIVGPHYSGNIVSFYLLLS